MTEKTKKQEKKKFEVSKSEWGLNQTIIQVLIVAVLMLVIAIFVLKWQNDKLTERVKAAESTIEYLAEGKEPANPLRGNIDLATFENSIMISRLENSIFQLMDSIIEDKGQLLEIWSGLDMNKKPTEVIGGEL